nr:MAG TPA: hypothetical protein [Caudoviricetes sp.]
MFYIRKPGRNHFSILLYVDFQHICTGNPQADCFLHLGQLPHIQYLQIG